VFCFCVVLQGMNFLVALLLVSVERDCERCFWLLLVLLEKVREGHLCRTGLVRPAQHVDSVHLFSC
jgi:hypothetical protein